MNKINLLIIVLVALAVGVVIGWFLKPVPAPVVGGTTRSDMTVAANFTVTGTTALAGLTNSSTMTVGGGTAITEHACATATWNPASIATSTLAAVTSTTITLTGAAMGDTCEGALSSATTTDIIVSCGVTGTASGSIFLTNVGASAVDLATGTARVCYTAH